MNIDYEQRKIIADDAVGAHGGRRVLYIDRSGNQAYELREPDLTREDVRSRIKIQEAITRAIEKDWRPEQSWSAQRHRQAKEKFLEEAFATGAQHHGVGADAAARIWYHVRRDLLGFGRIDLLMQDDELEDISCNGPHLPAYVYHREHGSMPTNIQFSEDELNRFVLRLAQMSGKQISIAAPILDCSLPDGSRLQATMRNEVTTRGSTFTIRRYAHLDFHPGSLVQKGTYTAEMLAYLWFMIERGANIMVAGTTASGKTTSLNVMSLFIPEDDKIVSIEDTREIDLYHENWIPGLTRGGFGEVIGGSLQGEVDMFDLLKAALRMRPDYLIVSEIRGREAHILFQGMATGHATMSTIHAASVDSMRRRLLHEPINVPEIQLENLDVVVVQVLMRHGDKTVRRVKEIAEFEADPRGEGGARIHSVYGWEPRSDRHGPVSSSRMAYNFHQDAGRNKQEIDAELARRTQVIQWMAESGCKAQVAIQMIRQYQHDAASVIDFIEGRGADPIEDHPDPETA